MPASSSYFTAYTTLSLLFVKLTKAKKTKRIPEIEYEVSFGLILLFSVQARSENSKEALKLSFKVTPLLKEPQKFE